MRMMVNKKESLITFVPFVIMGVNFCGMHIISIPFLFLCISI